MRWRQRRNLYDFADGLRDLLAGRATDDAEAAALNLAEWICIIGNANTDNEWAG